MGRHSDSFTHANFGFRDEILEEKTEISSLM